ncbi:MAG: hypothetical protein R6U17_04240 [Thermoplasmata archaeon]
MRYVRKDTARALLERLLSRGSSRGVIDMGRTVCDLVSGEFVWKYVFGEQASEQYRIYEELGVGTYGST